MITINFYRTYNDNLLKSVYQLVNKSYLADYRTLIVPKDDEMQESIDRGLWTYSQKLFIPHATSNDPLPESQPVYISVNADKSSNANLLLMVDHINLIKSNYEKIFIVASLENQKLFDQFKEESVNLQGSNYQVNYYILEKDKWLKRNLDE